MTQVPTLRRSTETGNAGFTKSNAGRHAAVGRLNALLLALLAWVASEQVARAEEMQQVSLTYEIGPGALGCPSQAEFERSVERQLGYRPFVDAAPRRVIIRASASAAGLHGTLLWRNADGTPQGERELAVDHRDCRELARSMAFAIVVQLQLLAGAPPRDTPRARERQLPAPEPEPEPEPDAAEPAPSYDTTPSEPPTIPVFERDRGPWIPSVGLGAGIASGLAPRASGLGRLFGALRQDTFSIEVGGMASWPTTERDSDGNGFRSNVWLGTLAPCLHYEALSGCAVGQLGQLRVRGVGLDRASTPTGLLGEAGVRLGLSQSLGPVVASLRLEALFVLTEWSVEVNDIESWTMPDSTFQLGLDVALPFVP